MSQTLLPQGAAIDSERDYPRLVFAAPYFTVVPIAEIIEPSVQEAVEGMLPSLVPPFVNDAANAAVANLAVLLTGSTMTGPLFVSPTMPTQPSQAASKAYVDTMLSTAGVPEVPAVPAGQIWGRQTGQWAALPAATPSLPLTGGTMSGAINMAGNAIINLPAVPILPNGAAGAQWVLNQIAASTLYQGIWNADTNQPDLTQPSTHQNSFTWIAKTTSPTGVVISPPIPGLQGLTVMNGDTVIYSAMAGQFQLLQAGGLTVTEADARYVALAGSTMTGPLMLSRDPVNAMEAATREWVLSNTAFPEAPNDGQAYGRNGLAHSWVPTLPVSGGILTGALTLNGNASTGLNPVPLQQLTSTLGNYVPIAGNVTITGPITMTGAGSNLLLNSNASANLQAVPLQQLTSVLTGYAPLGALTQVQVPPPPASPISGAGWFNASDQQLYIWNGATWVIAVNPPMPNLTSYAPLASPVFTGTPSMPTGTVGITQGAGNSTTALATTQFVQTAITTNVPVLNNVGRNLLHNALFQIAQRGPGPFTNIASYNADRWASTGSLDTVSYTVYGLNDADRAAIGDEAAANGLQNVFAGNAGASALNALSQPIEWVWRLAGKTVTVSFWARCTTGTLRIGLNILQYMGTGGSPSPNVRALATGNSVTISTTWARYSSTIALPSIAGKTLGSNGDSFTRLELWLSSGSAFNAAAGNIGVQSGTVQFWGMQLEVGSVMTQLEKLDPVLQLQQCQKFYQVGNLAFYAGATGNFAWGAFQPFIVQFRATPTITPNFTLQTNCSGSISNQSGYGFMAQMTSTAAGQAYLIGAYNASADL